MERQAQLMKKLQAWLFFSATADLILCSIYFILFILRAHACMYMSDGDILKFYIHDTYGLWWASHYIDDCLTFRRINASWFLHGQDNVSSIKAESGDQDATRARAQQEEQDRPNPGQADN